MDKQYTIYRPKNLNELTTVMRNVNTLTPIGGATSISRVNGEDYMTLPERILPLKGLTELNSIVKRERFIDFGAAVSLHSIFERGNTHIPPILHSAVAAAANAGIRVLGTIGGNIAGGDIRHSCLLPLLALDAKIEIRTAKETFWLALSRYCDESSETLRNDRHVILRIRVPLIEEWNISYYRRLGPSGFITGDTAYFVFLARTQKNILSDVKILFACGEIIKNKEFDNLLVGRSLPIERWEIEPLMKETRTIFEEAPFVSDFQKECFFNLIEFCMYKLT